jgi:hypothetical protein
MDAYGEMEPEETGEMPASGLTTDKKREADATERNLVEKLTKRIRADRAFFEKPFKQMREDMDIARIGAKCEPGDDDYVANIIGRHINQKTAALYAKNPKAVARRRDRMDFTLWDESTQSLMVAMQTVQMAVMPQPTAVGPIPPDPLAIMDPAVQEAVALVKDYEQGMAARQMAAKIGKTLEIMFAYYTSEQTPVDFKTSMKQLVRRACTTGVGYLKIGFQRQMQENTAVTERLADFQAQIRHIQTLMQEAEDEARPDHEVKERELKHAVESLQQQQYVLIREGLVFDFPESTRVIPDKLTRALTGFVGARWLTVEYLYTPGEVKDMFGVDLGKEYRRYSDDGTSRDTAAQGEMDFGDADREDMCCVWEHYDRQTGVVYLLADGHKAFLRQPGPPDVYVEDFWPVFALTFNEVENPKHLFPPSDVRLMLPMQREYNRARQGQAEHRMAARPRFMQRKGALDDESKTLMGRAKPFDVVELNFMDGTSDINNLLAPFPVPGVDPNLYETGQLFQDIQLVAGVQEAQFGATAKATATESSIAESSRIASVDSNVDDLDGFLTRVARAAGQIMLKEISPETVQKIAGPGSVWPEVTLDQIAEELYLEIQAGSSGKPNQAQDLANLERMMPYLIQLPGINADELAKEVLRRLDDRLDLTLMTKPEAPAIVAMNRMVGAAPPPGAMPEDQGGAGADNTSVPGGPAGTDAPMGNNQTMPSA